METLERNEQLEIALNRIARWEQDGTMDNVDILLHFLNAALNAMTPEIVSGMVGSVVELLELGDQLTQSRVFKLAPDLIQQADNALASHSTTKPSLRHLLGSMRDPDVQAGLQVMLSILQSFGKLSKASEPAE